MSTVTDMDIISNILGEVHLIESRLINGALRLRLGYLKEILEGVSREDIFERESLIEVRQGLRHLRLDIDMIIPIRVKYTDEFKEEEREDDNE